MKEWQLWSKRERRPFFCHITPKCDIDLEGEALAFAQDISFRCGQIFAKLFQNQYSNDKVMDQTLKRP